ncbi:lysozyme inhibitor LprI family protein [Pantoea allii]|uniref:lysozyme inhibitor LprI family protein n=1 Tax=Pantoea allii TaxID=574096 RepID=UPI003977AD17
MIKFHPRSVFFVLTLTYSLSSYAELNIQSIVESKEVTACTEKYGDNNSECLTSVSEAAEKKLNTVYQDKLKEISNYDYSQWWMGEKKQREDMKNAFIRSQELWLKYRQDYCKAASAGAEGIDGYSSVALSCQINMGIRRIEEIKMVHPDLSDG